MPQLQSSVPDPADSHGAGGRPPTLGGAARIEDLKVAADLVKRHVRVAEQDRVGVREAGAHSLEAPPRRAGVVKEPNGHPLELDRQLLGELALQLRAVDIAVDRRNWPEALQLGEDLSLAEVTEMDDQVRARRFLQASLGYPAVSPRQMGIGDQGEPDGSVSPLVISLGALALGELALEVRGLRCSPSVLLLLVGRDGVGDRLVLLGGPLVLLLPKLLGCRFLL